MRLPDPFALPIAGSPPVLALDLPGDVGAGPHGHEHPPAVRAELDVTGGMVAGAGGEAGHDRLRRPARLEVARAVGIADHGVERRHVDPARIRSRRVEGDPERSVQAAREQRVPVGMRGAVGGTQDADPAHGGLGDEYVAVRRDADQPRIIQGREPLHRVAGRNPGNQVPRRLDHGGRVAGRGAGERGRHVLRDQPAPAPRSVAVPIPIGPLSGQHRFRTGVTCPRCRRTQHCDEDDHHDDMTRGHRRSRVSPRSDPC